MPKWEINDFSEGIVDKIVDDHLTPNALKDAQNFISIKFGSAETRGGQKHLNESPLPGIIQGLYSYYGNDKRQIITVAGGKAYLWDALSEAFVEIKAGLDNTAPTLFETCVNYMVAANGIDPPWKWDGETASSLANAPADGQFPTLYKEKLFLVPKSDPSLMLWSKSFYPEDCSELDNYMYINEGDGDKITCLYNFLNEIVIFKRRSIHVLMGTNKDDFRLTTPETKVGATGPRAVARYHNYLYFVGEDGLYVWNGMSATNISRARIPGLWKNINIEHLDKAAVVAWKGMIWFALPEGSSSYNNLVLVYVPSGESGKWWLWRGINASCFSIFYDKNENILYSGDSYAGYVNRQDIGTDDFGEPISAYMVPPTLDKDPEVLKYFSTAQIMDTPQANDVDIQVAIDYGDFTPLEYEGGDDLVRTYRFFNEYKGRVLQTKLLCNTTKGCEVRGLKVHYDKVRLPR